MKFNKDKYKSSGRKPSSSSEGQLRKRQRTGDPSTFVEWTPAAEPQVEAPATASAEDMPIDIPAAELPSPAPAEVPDLVATTIQGEIGPAAASGSDQSSNILDDARLAIKRMESIITPDDLARTRNLPVGHLTREIAHDLAKVLLCASELGTRYVETSRTCREEGKKTGNLQAEITKLRAELKDAKAKVMAADQKVTRATNDRDDAVSRAEGLAKALVTAYGEKDRAVALATERGTQLEELRGQAEAEKAKVTEVLDNLETEKAKAVEAFKDGDEAQDWLAETYQEGFEDAKNEVLKLHPELDLSSVVALGSQDQS